jgi:type IV secretion system protein VirB10
MDQQALNSVPPDTQPPAPAAAHSGIVSVNARGGSSSGMFGKLVFVFAVVAILVVGALFSLNRWRSHKRAELLTSATQSKTTNKPAQVGKLRTFDDDPPPLPANAQPVGGTAPVASTLAEPLKCADGSEGVAMFDASNKPMLGPSGTQMRVCKDGHVLVPAVEEGAKPVPLAGGQATPHNGGGSEQKPASRYAGDVMLPTGGSTFGGGGQAQGPTNPNSPLTTLALLQALGQKGAQAPGQGAPAPGLLPGAATPPAANPPGSLGSMLTPSDTPKVQAAMLGDRSMILPKGRSIDCAMTMRLISEVSGMTSCVLTQNVYSDDGRVVLLERGSEASGEYRSAMAQGQSRIFVLWDRIKTPSGVVINLNSPGADALGTAGLDGYVDNHWWERLGAAFLLSFVQDAISYEVAKSAAQNSNSAAGSTVVYQNTAATGDKMAEKILDSTINIKPTLYKNQGDRASIYVARDLDFSNVYALRAH